MIVVLESDKSSVASVLPFYYHSQCLILIVDISDLCSLEDSLPVELFFLSDFPRIKNTKTCIDWDQIVFWRLIFSIERNNRSQRCHS